MTHADHAASEVIGQGPLWKMIRAALTDPDGETWRYSISVGGSLVAGDQIASLIDTPARPNHIGAWSKVEKAMRSPARI